MFYIVCYCNYYNLQIYIMFVIYHLCLLKMQLHYKCRKQVESKMFDILHELNINE